MSSIRLYKTPIEFLNETASLLEENEMENNMILGNCFNLLKFKMSFENCYFVNVCANDLILASSVKINTKLLITGKNPQAIKDLAHFYKRKGIELAGIIGERSLVELFVEKYSTKTMRSRALLVQSLEKTSWIELTEGSLAMADQSHSELLTDWTFHFFEEEELLPKRSLKETRAFIETLIEQEDLFYWKHQEKPVSMAGIIRKTKNTNIIGLVFTPPELRGKGFGKTCVRELSWRIVNSGHKQSGLLVYEANHRARHIYEVLGYRTVTELTDVDFVLDASPFFI